MTKPPSKPVQLSAEEQAKRAPPPPDELVEALQNRAHRDVGNGRPARVVSGKKRT